MSRVSSRATGVGSLPGTDAREYTEAVAMVLGELTLPHIPELPGRGAPASMIGRTLAIVVDLGADLQPGGWRLTGSGLRSGGIDQRRAASLLAQDLDDLEEQAQGFSGPFKLQITGPWTLAATVERPRGDKILADHGARRELAQGLAAGVADHIADVRRRLPEAELLVQVDEPALPAVLAGSVPTASGFGRHRSVDAQGAAPALEELAEAVHGEGAKVIAHCCARDIPYDLLARTGYDGVGVDLDQVDAPGYDALAGLLEHGSLVHLGVIGTGSGTVPTPAQVANRVERFLDVLGLEPCENLVLTSACGLAGSDQQTARAIIDVLAKAARSLS